MILRYNDHLMALLMAVLLSVFAAVGIWASTLFSWAVGMAPWMNYQASLLGWLSWCGIIVIYTFPDGRFIPRWTLWLSVLLLPLSFLLSFNINIFLNPDNWPNPFYFLPNLVFVGSGFFSILWRYFHNTDSEQKRRLRWYVINLPALMVANFVDFLTMDLYYALTGKLIFQGYHAAVVYTQVHEPNWYALEVFFAVGLAVSVFRHKLLEN
jgi:hypothetical protein